LSFICVILIRLMFNSTGDHVRLRNEHDVNAMLKRIEKHAKKLKMMLTPQEREQLFTLLAEKDTVQLCRICKLSTMKKMLLWILGEKEIQP